MNLRGQLGSGETILAAMPLDLDSQLTFAQGWLALTERRLIAQTPGIVQIQEWPLDATRKGLQLEHFDHAGVGTLELRDATSRLAHWRYTLEQNIAALRLIRRFRQEAPGPVFNSILAGTAGLQLVFALLLSLAFTI